MKNLAAIIVVLFFSSPDIKSQLPSMPSPTAANLGLYVEIPISAYTGTPGISIPLYEIKGKNITVPVSLSYHASGIRPEVHPGPTGLGWTLFAGGAITRTVRGAAPDECDSENDPAGRLLGYLSFGGNSWIAQSDWKTSLVSTFQNSLDCQSYSKAFTGLDIESDEFSFNFLGISGKFYFDQHGMIRVQSDRPLKVSFDPTRYLEMSELDFNYYNYNYSSSGNATFFHKAIRDFVITDEFGNRYCFGGKDAIEISDPIAYGRGDRGGIPPDGYQMCVTSWFMTRIESADGTDVFTFEYERGPFISQLYKWQDAYYYNGSLCNSPGGGWQGYQQDGNFVSPVYLTGIRGSNGVYLSLTYSESDELDYPDAEYDEIFHTMIYTDPYSWLSRTSQIPRLKDYNSNNKLDNIRWLKLDKIHISGTGEPRLRVVDFRYNNNPAERLFLDSLCIYGRTDREHYSYGFFYKNRSNLRPYLQRITDHWGFDNGNGFTSSFNPSQRSLPISGNRDIPDADYKVRKESNKGYQYRHRDWIDSESFWNNNSGLSWNNINAIIQSWLEQNPNIQINYE